MLGAIDPEGQRKVRLVSLLELSRLQPSALLGHLVFERGGTQGWVSLGKAPEIGPPHPRPQRWRESQKLDGKHEQILTELRVRVTPSGPSAVQRAWSTGFA